MNARSPFPVYGVAYTLPTKDESNQLNLGANPMARCVPSPVGMGLGSSFSDKNC